MADKPNTPNQVEKRGFKRQISRWIPACAAGTVLAVMVWIWLVLHINGSGGNQFAADAGLRWVAVGRLAGLLAMTLLMFQVLFIARAPRIEPLYGMDRLTRWHHNLGIVVVLLVAVHVFSVTHGMAQSGGNTMVDQFRQFLKDWDDIPEALGGLALLLAAAGLSIARVRRLLGYERWHASHLAMYAALVLILGHQLELGFDLNETVYFRVIWYIMLGVVGFQLFLFRLMLPWALFGQHRFQVDSVTQETSDVVSVRITGRKMESMRVRPGQFVIVRFLARGFWMQPHPFSISAPFDGKTLRLSIKKLGDFTRRIPELQPGTRVVVDGPHGAFTPDRRRSNRILLIAGGIGITPIRCLAEALLDQQCDVALLYGNRDRHGVVFEQELQALAERFPQFRLVHVINDGTDWDGETGIIDHHRIARLVPDCANRDVFLCGPPAMMTGVLAALRALQVPKRNIHFERFSF